MSTPNLVLLPGLNCDAAVWAPQVQAFSATHHCHVMDYGLADTLPAMAQKVLDSAPATFAMAGHSMGGRVALEVLRLAPQRVDRLALMSTGAHPLGDGDAGAKEKAGRLALLSQAQRSGMRAMGAVWAKPMVHPSLVGGPLFEQVLDMLERSSPERFAAQVNALINRPDATNLLPTIRCPALVLTGREDGWSPPAAHQAMADAMTGVQAELVIVEQCGHMCTMEQPEAVNAAFARWLAL